VAPTLRGAPEGAHHRTRSRGINKRRRAALAGPQPRGSQGRRIRRSGGAYGDCDGVSDVLVRHPATDARVSEALMLRALAVYETHRVDFAEAYLVASAESAGVDYIASFDRNIDRVATINRVQP